LIYIEEVQRNARVGEVGETLGNCRRCRRNLEVCWRNIEELLENYRYNI